MRILHLGKYYAPHRGGIERYVQALAQWTVERGHAVCALVHQSPGHWRTGCERMGGVEIHRVGCIAAPMYTPISPGFPFELARVLGKFKPELLHLHLPNPSCVAALLSPHARRLPWIVHWHADISPDARDWRLRGAYFVYRLLERALLARASVIIATSASYRDASVALAPWQAKTRVIPLGTAEDVAATGTNGAALWPGDAAVDNGLRLLAVGRLSYYKGFDILIDALARAPHARLLLVGSGELERSLRQRASRLDVEDRITFAGAVDDDALASACAAADAFVLPSLDRSEAFGLVLLEAMRARLPIIASAIPGSGIGHVMVDGETGLLVKPGDAEALGGAIAELESDPALRRRLGDAGHARWQRLFTLEHSATQVLDLYREFLDSPPSLSLDSTHSA
ncbi:MAG: glycosyltransferase [Rhodanobacteraceae bacterium]